MSQTNDLKAALKTHFQWHGARLAFLVLFIQALYRVKTVNLVELATALNPKVKQNSNQRRLQRFFTEYALDEDSVARFVVALIPKPDEGYTLSMDRTTWQFGQMWLNFLVLSICHNGVAIPVCWMMLPKQGNSNTLERIALLEIFISLFGRRCINCLAGDREFIGNAWFTYLKSEGISLRQRIKRNFQVSTQNGSTIKAVALFQHLAVGQTLILNDKRTVLGHDLYLIGMRLSATEWLILATDQRPETALEDYARRWEIETLFGILKSRGFRLEETHLTDPERLSKLFALLCIATLWAFTLGEWLHQQQPIPIKKHGRLAKSLFRNGLDSLRTLLFFPQQNRQLFKQAINLLSCT